MGGGGGDFCILVIVEVQYLCFLGCLCYVVLGYWQGCGSYFNVLIVFVFVKFGSDVCDDFCCVYENCYIWVFGFFGYCGCCIW